MPILTFLSNSVPTAKTSYAVVQCRTRCSRQLSVSTALCFPADCSVGSSGPSGIHSLPPRVPPTPTPVPHIYLIPVTQWTWEVGLTLISSSSGQGRAATSWGYVARKEQGRNSHLGSRAFMSNA